MQKCASAERYKATRAPTCNNGDPCDACLEKWRRAQARRQRKPFVVTKRVDCEELYMSHKTKA